MNYKKIVFLVSFLVIVSCLFNFSHTTVKAMTTDEMIALIQKLQQQIADLQKQLAQAQGTQTVWCHDFNKNLTAGASNEEVASLHTVLEKEGFDIFDEEKANKEFGESTASAISGLQQKYADEILTPLGLKYSTGILGKSTRTKLNKLFGCNANLKSEETILSLVVSEQVKCLFKGAQTDQKCYGASSNYSNYSCAGTEGCVVDVRGQQGDKITWKSSCGGYAYTTIDGQNEYANFSCGAASASLNVISPNGRDVWELSKAFEIKWKQTQNANVSVIVRNKQLPGTGGDLWFNMVVNGSVAGIAGENRVWWDIPNYLNAHTGYEVCVAGSFSEPTGGRASLGTDGTGQDITLEDCSDSPFAIHEATISATAKTCAEMSSNQQYYFDVCNKGGFDNVCFNKFSGVYQGCVRNIRDDCTKYNSNAQVNMLCSIAGIPVPVPATPLTTQTPTPTTITPVTPTETGVGVYRFEIIDSAANCQACPPDTACTPSPCLPASTFIIYTAKVSVYDEKGNFIASKDTSSGKAIFDNLPYGNYVAYISAAGYQEDKTSFTVGANFATNSTSILTKTTATSVSSKSITVISPNGGEKLIKGTTHPIKWNSSNVTSVYIKLRKGTDIKSADTYNGSEGEVSKIISNSGIFFWTVPSTLPDGSDYSIRIIDSTAAVLDDSDSLFSITASPVATPTSGGGSESSQTTAVPTPIPASSAAPIPSTSTLQKTTGHTMPLNQIANILEAAQAAINQISQGINDLLKNR